jgi:TatD DNase family protein
VETDAPFLTPMPHRGRPNASRLVPHTVRALAEVTGVELDELCRALTATAERVFGSWDV